MISFTLQCNYYENRNLTDELHASRTWENDCSAYDYIESLIQTDQASDSKTLNQVKYELNIKSCNPFCDILLKHNLFQIT